MVGYYIEGLPIDIRQKIFNGLEDIGSMTIKRLLEEKNGYPKYKRMGLSDEQITYQKRMAERSFVTVNNIIIDNGRSRLFKKPSDTYESSKRYLELLKREDEETLVNYFGCTWDEYIPESKLNAKFIQKYLFCGAL